LVLRLSVKRAVWHLDRDSDPGIPMLAFAEEGGTPLIPGPLVRVPVGTVIDASVRNTLERDTLVIHGLTAPGTADPLVVPPGATAIRRFTASRIGTYLYWGTTTRAPLIARYGEDSNLGAAFVVDPPGGRGSSADRILVITEHGDSASHDVPGARVPIWTAINGKSWPHTERFAHSVGDSIHWRVINASSSPHPMHLHGAYFRVDAKGGTGTDTLYAPERRRMAATERVLPGQTMQMTWSPERPGGWLFHCHAIPHVAPHLSVDKSPAPTHSDADPDRHTFHGMGGLVVAVSVAAPPGYVAERAVASRRIRLLVQSDSGPSDGARRFGYVLQEGERLPPPDSVPIPGPTLVLTRGEPTVLEIINRTPEPTSVHWHGIELESYFDGVTGVSGLPGRTTPAIQPGTRFDAHITPRRAGTFMYHTHFSEMRQYVAGLTGALLVLEPGERWDPDRDRVFLFGDARGRAGNVVNGSGAPAFRDLVAGTTYRLRFMNIAVVRPTMRVHLLRDGRPLTWRAIAKDGWTLDSAQATVRPSVGGLGSGETADFEFTPDRPGELTLEFRAANGHLFLSAPIRVR
jgi:FtsP/CotA-like multicopper oxidase with cupredoxin domain